MAPASDLTKREREAWNFISAFAATNARTPSVREVAEGMGLKSPSQAWKLLKGLQLKGYILRSGKRKHDLQFLKKRRSPQMTDADKFIASKGWVPVFAFELKIKTADGGEWGKEKPKIRAVALPSALLAEDEREISAYICDASAQTLGVMEGDVVVVRAAEKYKEGCLIAVKNGRRAGVKRVRREKGALVVEPDPAKVGAKELLSRCLGKAVMIIREFG